MDLIWVLLTISIALVIWISFLTLYIWQQNQRSSVNYRSKEILQSLMPGVDKPDLQKKLIHLLENIDDINEREEFLAKNFKKMSVENLKNIQKVSISRYNPYQEVGGDQSFTLALLNGANTGLVLTSLHTRSGTRIYAKSVLKGRSEVELAKEEAETLDEAMKQ